MDVELLAETVSAGVSTALQNGWVYRLVGTTVTLLHTNSSGRVLQLKARANASHPWEYTEKFVVPVGSSLNVYFSRGQSPIPPAVLAGQAAAFETIVVPPPTPPSVVVSPTGTSALAVTPQSRLTLTDHSLKWTTPTEPALLPLTLSPPRPTYATGGGLLQGGSAWSNPSGSGSPVRAENSAAPVPAAADRERERAIQLSGTVDAAATAVTVRVLNLAGNALNLLADGSATTPQQQVSAVLAAPTTPTPPGSPAAPRSFQVTLLFQNATQAFGPVQILAQATGLAKPVLEVAFFVLVGVRTALIDDGEPAPRSRGEADETVVLDFLTSPQTSVAALSTQTRVRRMVPHHIRRNPRPYNVGDPTSALTTPVAMPEMPQWMGELQLAGLTREALEDLLQRRKRGLPTAPTRLDIGFNSALTLNWDGPNSASTTRPYQYTIAFSQSSAARIQLDATEKLTGVDAAGAVAAAFTPAPTPIVFPVAGRRVPQVVLGVSRPWLRVAGSASVPTTIVEFQPPLVNGAGREIMRGGDGTLNVSGVTIDAQPLVPGLDVTGTTFATPANADIDLPTFRVLGDNATRAEIDALCDVAVNDFFTRNATVASVTLLPLLVWQQMVRAIVAHESINRFAQFENRGAGRRTFGAQVFGHENDMPLFGAPAGYGTAQLDNPPVTDDQAWSFFENVKRATLLVMSIKAIPAFALVSPHLSTPPTRRQRAVYRRAIVRAYNGGSEFRFQGGDFEIFPTSTSAPRLTYTNLVLGTAVVYAGVSVAVPFTTADFGAGL